MPRIDELIKLVSNVMEAYTTTLFLDEEQQGEVLTLCAFYSLSSNIKKDCKVQSGEGIIGWVFREQKPVFAGYFDKRDATTLKFYEKDEDIKSLLAIPLPEKYGVLCIDSKKSYGFNEEKEKILRQIADFIISIIKAENEIAEKKLIENFLSLSIRTHEIVVNIKDINEYIKEFFKLFHEQINIELMVFVEEQNSIYYLDNLTNNNIFQQISYESFDEYGLMGWVLKNRNELYLEKISKNDKSFMMYRHEPFDCFTNFLGLPLFSEKRNKKGALALVKKINEKWLPKEKKLVIHLSNLFFEEYLYKK